MTQNASVKALRNVRIMSKAAVGVPVSQIAREEGINRSRVSHIVNSEANREFLEESYLGVQEVIAERLPQLVALAMDFAETQLKSSSAYDKGARMNLAKNILEMAMKHTAMIETETGIGPCVCCHCRAERARVVNPD